VEDKRNAYKVMVIQPGRVKDFGADQGVYGVMISTAILKTKSGKMCNGLIW
jgi:hypothetical protein